MVTNKIEVDSATMEVTYRSERSGLPEFNDISDDEDEHSLSKIESLNSKSPAVRDFARQAGKRSIKSHPIALLVGDVLSSKGAEITHKDFLLVYLLYAGEKTIDLNTIHHTKTTKRTMQSLVEDGYVKPNYSVDFRSEAVQYTLTKMGEFYLFINPEHFFRAQGVHLSDIQCIVGDDTLHRVHNISSNTTTEGTIPGLDWADHPMTHPPEEYVFDQSQHSESTQSFRTSEMESFEDKVRAVEMTSFTGDVEMEPTVRCKREHKDMVTSDPLTVAEENEYDITAQQAVSRAMSETPTGEVLSVSLEFDNESNSGAVVLRVELPNGNVGTTQFNFGLGPETSDLHGLVLTTGLNTDDLHLLETEEIPLEKSDGNWCINMRQDNSLWASFRGDNDESSEESTSSFELASSATATRLALYATLFVMMPVFGYLGNVVSTEWFFPMTASCVALVVLSWCDNTA